MKPQKEENYTRQNCAESPAKPHQLNWSADTHGGIHLILGLVILVVELTDCFIRFNQRAVQSSSAHTAAFSHCCSSHALVRWIINRCMGVDCYYHVFISDISPCSVISLQFCIAQPLKVTTHGFVQLRLKKKVLFISVCEKLNIGAKIWQRYN